MRPAESGPKRDRGWRRRVPARATELLNSHWHKLRGGPNQRSCPICAATIPTSDDAVHHGGELYHRGCALHEPLHATVRGARS